MLTTDYKFGEVHGLVSHIEAGADKVHFKNIFETDNGGVAIVAFKKGQMLEEHVAPAEVMVYVAEGEIEFAITGTAHVLRAGEFLLLGSGVAHSVLALADSKMVLTKIKA